MKARKLRIVAAAVSAGTAITSLGMPATTSAATTRMLGQAGPIRLQAGPLITQDETDWFPTRTSQQMCFNAWGRGLNVGYHLWMHKRGDSGGSGGLLFSSPTYYTAKSGVCSRWYYQRDVRIQGGITSHYTGPTIYTDIWLYWN